MLIAANLMILGRVSYGECGFDDLTAYPRLKPWAAITSYGECHLDDLQLRSPREPQFLIS